MSRAHAVMVNDLSGAIDATGAVHAARAVVGVALVVALLVLAAVSFAAPGGAQPATDELAQFGD